MEIPQQSMYYVLFVETLYNSINEALTKAPDDIAIHKMHSDEMRAQSSLLMAGAFLDKKQEKLGTMAVFTTREAAEEYARNDPFVLKGMVSKWYIREWANLFA